VLASAPMSTVSLLVLLPALMSTVTAGDLAPPPNTQAIAGGETVNTCGWPSVVLVRGNGYLCTGNLIAPQIVATAAHCIEVMEPNTRVYFGDTANTAKEKVAVEYCMGSPDFVSSGDGTIAFSQVGNDWGFCKLEAPVTDVEPIPPIYGCELDLVAPGAEIVRVGFGKETLATNQFFKRWVETTIVSIPFVDANGWPTQLSEGGGGKGTCPGDSGGPSFLRMADDTWRMVAIQSTQPVEDAQGNPIECGTEPNNTAVISQGVPFIEAQSGIDVTACFSTDGSWDPSFECGGFVQDPGLGGGNWTMGCHTGPLADFSAVCGESFDQLYPDLTPPVVTIVDPPGPVELPWEGDNVSIPVLVDAHDGEGWGVSHVELIILDAQTEQELALFDSDAEPHTWDPTFPQGSYLIKAIAHDNAGHVAETPTRSITIGVEPPADDDDDGDGDGDGDGGTSDGSGGHDDPDSTDGGDGADRGGSAGETGDDGDGSAGSDTSDGGCSCRSSTPGGGALPWLGVVLVLARRRRAT
jgi:MYXO-CTERM domain-containing protein